MRAHASDRRASGGAPGPAAGKVAGRVAPLVTEGGNVDEAMASLERSCAELADRAA